LIILELYRNKKSPGITLEQFKKKKPTKRKKKKSR